MAIQGVRHTDNFVTDQRPKNWREGILLMWPNGMAPLTGLTSGMRSQDTDDPEFNYWTKTLQRQRLELDGNHSDSVDLTVTADAQKLVEGHLLRIEETGEIVRVNADPSSGTTVPVTRGFAGTSAQVVNAGTGTGVNPNVIVIGTAYPENADTPTGLNFDPVKVFNYTQIFRNSLDMSRTAMKTRLRTGDQVREAKRETLEYHSIEMERAWFWGSRWEGTVDGLPARTTGGIHQFVTDNAPGNVVDRDGAATDLETLEGLQEQIFQFGSSEKMAFCGNKALLTIQQIVRKNADYQLVQGQKEFGMNVTRLVSPFGTIVLKTHPLFNYAPGGTAPAGGEYHGWNSSMFVLDMENLRYRYLKDSDTQYLPDRQGNGIDGKKSEYLTECGLEVHHPETHFVIKGLTNAAADT